MTCSRQPWLIRTSGGASGEDRRIMRCALAPPSTGRNLGDSRLRHSDRGHSDRRRPCFGVLTGTTENVPLRTVGLSTFVLSTFVQRVASNVQGHVQGLSRSKE